MTVWVCRFLVILLVYPLSSTFLACCTRFYTCLQWVLYALEEMKWTKRMKMHHLMHSTDCNNIPLEMMVLNKCEHRTKWSFNWKLNKNGAETALEIYRAIYCWQWWRTKKGTHNETTRFIFQVFFLFNRSTGSNIMIHCLMVFDRWPS